MAMPPEGVLLPGLDAGWSDPSQMIPGGQMPVAQAGQNGLLAALLGAGQPQPDTTAATQALLFQHLNRPAQGPWTAIINPIVAAIQARRIAPQLQAQQAQAQQLERLKMLQALAAAGASGATANYRNLQGQQIQGQLDAEKNLTPEMRQLLYLIKNRMAPDANTLEQGKQGMARTIQQGQDAMARTLQSGQDAAARTAAQVEGRATQGSLNRAATQEWRNELKDQFDRRESNLFTRQDRTTATTLMEGERNRESRERTAEANRTATRNNLIDQMEQTGLLQAQRLNEMRAAKTDEAAQLNQDLNIFSRLAQTNPKMAQGFFEQTIAPQYEAVYKDKFDIGTVGMWDFLTNWGGSSLYTPRGVTSTLPQGSRPPSSTSGTPRAPVQPVRPPARTLAPGQRPPADAQPVDFESLSDDDLLSISDEQAAVMPSSVRRRRSLLKGKQKFGLGTR